MKKGLYILSIILLTLCLLLSIPMLCILTVEQINGDSPLMLMAIMLGGLGMLIFMFEWEIVFPILFALLAVIVISFIYAVRNKLLPKSTIVALVSINSVTVVMIVARAIAWFAINAII